jgi:hypothetical protein
MAPSELHTYGRRQSIPALRETWTPCIELLPQLFYHPHERTQAACRCQLGQLSCRQKHTSERVPSTLLACIRNHHRRKHVRPLQATTAVLHDEALDNLQDCWMTCQSCCVRVRQLRCSHPNTENQSCASRTCMHPADAQPVQTSQRCRTQPTLANGIQLQVQKLLECCTQTVHLSTHKQHAE